MINILLPSMGSSEFFKDSFFHKLLTEINGKTMLELVVDEYRAVAGGNYIFIFPDEDCRKFHLDDSAKVLIPDSRVIKLKGRTAGALCTCLMAIDSIDNEEPLVIVNADQIIEVDYNEVLEQFGRMEADGGIMTFPSIHPRWSYAKKKDGQVIEVAEKRPFTRDAVAGFYYFRHGADFVEAARSALLKRSDLNGAYYISAAINELILMGKKICYYDIETWQFHSFYSPAKIKEYEESFK